MKKDNTYSGYRELAIFIITMLVLCTSPVFASITGKEIITKVRENFESLDNFSAKFTQVFEWQLAEEEQEIEGTIIAAKGDRYRIETEDQIIVTDGEIVWNYSKLKNQVIIDNLGDTAESPLMRDLLVKYTEGYEAKLLREEKVEEKNCYVVELTAKEDEFIETVTIWVDMEMWLTVRIRQVDINQNANTYYIRNIVTNQVVPIETFEFFPPESAEIIDMREDL